MKNPYALRRPWVAFLIGLLLSPFIGMLYVGRARWAGFYLLAWFAVIALFFVIYPDVLGEMTARDALPLFVLALTLIGAIHAAIIGWRRPKGELVWWFSRWYVVLGIPLLYVGLVYTNKYWGFPPFDVPSESMAPGIGINDVILSSRPTYFFSEPRRGDVVAFWSRGNKAVYVKRLAGLPCERVAMRDGRLFVNGKGVAQTVLPLRSARETLGDHSFMTTVGVNMFANTDEITIPSGYYFVLGDNRDNSLDSRSPEIGLIARKDIIGKVVVKTFDGETRKLVWRWVE